MQRKFYTPHPLLQEFINCIMVVHAEVATTATSVVCPYPPAPQNSLFFYINDCLGVQHAGATTFVQQPRAVLVGPQITRVMLNIGRSHKAVRVGFQPGGLYRLMGVSMAQLVDGHLDAADVYGSDITEVISKLQDAPNFDTIHQVVENFLLRKAQALKPALPFDKAMLELMRAQGNLPIEKVAYMACLSLRQFERVSRERTGLSPKFFARLVRFSKAYRMREENSLLPWTYIAHACGYFDQMHFIRDFKQFAGLTSTTIERALEHAPIRMQAGMRL